MLGAEDLDELLDRVATYRSDRGIPAVELTSPDGSTLTIAQVEDGAFLMCTDSLGDSMHSVGPDDAEGTVVFDYFGSYTEVPATNVVPAELGRASARAFVCGQNPTVVGLTLEPD